MSEDRHAQISNIDFAAIGIPLGSTVIKEAEMWMNAHGVFLTNMERVMADWVRRQREAFDASSRSIRKIYDCRNIFELVQAQHEWVSDCLNWTASEIRAVGSDAVAMTRQATERVEKIARERSDELRKQRKAPVKTEADRPLQRAAAE